MLIVEGTDLVGKTTFCRKLLEHLPKHIYAHFSRLPPQFDYYWGYVDRMSRYVVQDRFHMSELAYAWARGDEPRVSPEQYRLIDAELRRLGTYTVVITSLSGKLLNARMRGGEMYDIHTICQANVQFQHLAYETSHREYRGYLPDVDYTIECRDGKPFPNDDDVVKVLAAYRVRQELVDHLELSRSIVRRRP